MFYTAAVPVGLSILQSIEIFKDETNLQKLLKIMGFLLFFKKQDIEPISYKNKCVLGKMQMSNMYLLSLFYKK